jgi:ATP-binding cassette subfamily B protein
MGFFGNLNADKYDRQYDDRYLVRRLLSYFRPHRRRVLYIAIAVMLFSITGVGFPIAISASITALEAQGDTSIIVLLLASLFAVAVLDYVFYWIRRRLTGRVVADVITDLRKDAFDAALKRDLAFYDENKTGKVVSRITNDTNELSSVIIISIDIITQITDFLLLFVVLLTREWRLTLILVGIMPVIMLVAIGFRHWARAATRQGSRAMAAVNDTIQESVAGIMVAKNFRQEAMIHREFNAINDTSYRINLRRGFVLATVFPTLNGLAGFAFAIILYIGATFVLDDVIEAGTWFLFIQGIDRFWFPFINLSAFWSQIQQGLSATERIFALIDADNTVNQTASEPVGRLRGGIEFRSVVFQYNTGERVLNDFSLTIAPNESVAFVGHTGAGKSTIIKLITRFYEFQGGDIRIDGRDIRTLALPEYRRQLGLVPQQPFLFRGTVLDNIRYARPEASDEEIAVIANSVGSGEWLAALPQGLSSEVGERGSRLSMGQRQLVSLMRVLVQQPAIFILDEATASIDPFTEAQIQEALDLILAQSTSILIAHRLSTVRSADRIIVLRQGSIIEQGNHKQLVEQGGHYAELYNTYFRHQSLSYVENARQLLAQPETGGNLAV